MSRGGRVWNRQWRHTGESRAPEEPGERDERADDQRRPVIEGPGNPVEDERDPRVIHSQPRGDRTARVSGPAEISRPIHQALTMPGCASAAGPGSTRELSPRNSPVIHVTGTGLIRRKERRAGTGGGAPGTVVRHAWKTAGRPRATALGMREAPFVAAAERGPTVVRILGRHLQGSSTSCISALLDTTVPASAWQLFNRFHRRAGRKKNRGEVCGRTGISTVVSWGRSIFSRHGSRPRRAACPRRPPQRGRAPTNPATWSNRSATSAYDGDR